MPRLFRKSPEPHRRMWMIAGLLAVLPCFAGAEQLWSVHAFGIRVGELTVEMRETENRYAAKSSFKTTGLAGMLARIRFDITAKGTRQGETYRPAAYTGDIHTGRRQSATALDFTGPVPRKTQGTHAPAAPISDAALAGAIDPMTMMWRVLRDRANPCKLNSKQFDGTRLVAIRLLRSRPEGDRIVCVGEYHRIGGYTQEELAEITTTPLEVTFARNGALWRAERILIDTRHGPATIRRRDTP